MKTDIATVYRSAWAFAFACPLLFLIPVLVELAQHVVEWRAGMYDGIAGAKAAEADPLRLQFGFAKTLALLMGLSGTTAQWTGYALVLFSSIAGIYFMAWTVAWALGNAAIGPIRSVRIMAGSFWRTILLLLAGVLPLMIAHYALSFGAIFAPAILDWPLLLLDALVVGLLALTMAGSNAIAARHAAAVKGKDLRPEPAVARGLAGTL